MTTQTIIPSEERLRELLARVSPPAEGWHAGLPTVEVHAIITELLSLRTSSAMPAVGEDGITDEMLNAGYSRVCEISSVTAFDDYTQAEIYKAMRALDPAFSHPLPSTEPSEAMVEAAFRNVDDSDWKHLFAVLPDTGRGRFWKAVMTEARAALNESQSK